MYKGQGVQCTARALPDRRRALGRAGLSNASQPKQLVAGSRLAAEEDSEKTYVGTSMFQPCGFYTS